MPPRPRFRDRFFTPKVARAMMSPLGIVLAGAGAAVGLATGLPVVAAAGMGVAAWAARVGLALPKGPPPVRVAPAQLSMPWQGFVKEALDSKARFDRAVVGTPPGPLHDRLAEIGGRLQDGVETCWRIARRGHDIDGALRSLDTSSAQRELAELRRAPATTTSARTIESLEAQVASAQRLAAVSGDARDRLRLLDARLDEMVARAVELSVSSDTDPDVTGLGTDVDSLVDELDALRRAVEETNHTGGAGAVTPAGS
jgi:hypothetical protein